MAGTPAFVVSGFLALGGLALVGACANVVQPPEGAQAVGLSHDAALPSASGVAPDGSAPLASANAPSGAPPASGAPSSSAAPVPSGAPSAAPSGSAEPPAAASGKQATATLGEPKFEGGDVPKAKAAIDKLGKAIAKCVNEHGGLRTAKGTIEVQFLVRAQGIAEGVDITDSKGIDPEAKKCVRDLLKKKAIGTPSSDPVGVTFKVDLESAAP